ncbi:SAL1 phosphatase [Bienertia sinuspersici]
MVTSLFKLLNLYHHSLLFQDFGDLKKGCAHDTLECIRLLINDTIGSDKLTTPMMFHLYRLKLCWLLSIMAGLKEGDQYSTSLALLDQRKVVFGVLACPNPPLAPLSVQSSGSKWLSFLSFNR